MQVCRVTTTLVLLATTNLMSAAAAETAAGWQTDFEKAHAAAAAANKPLLVHFYADWCGPCRAMESTILHTPEVLKELGRSVVAVKINSDHRKDLVNRFGVAALPTDVFVGPDGEVLSRAVGSPGKQGYVNRIAEVAAKFAPAQEAVAANDAAQAQPQTDGMAGPGLEGFSPVALITERVWEKGDPQFAAEHEGIVYHMANSEELRRFKSDPNKYAPQLKGNDPCLLSTRGQVVAGDIAFGAFFQGQLYLLSSKENRELFKDDPHRYTRTVNVLLTEQPGGLRIH